MKTYLEWERQATVLPILMCMEAWTAPTTKYFGAPWPITYIKYDGDIVSWYTRMDGLHKFGQLIIDGHMKEGGIKKFENNVGDLANKFDQLFKEFESLRLDSLSEQKLLDLFRKIHSLYIDWFVLGAVCEPVGIRGEHLVSELVKHFKNPDKAVSLLTTTTRKSFSKRELEDILAIAVHFKLGEDVDYLLDVHSKKWSWVHNNYFTTEVLEKAHFKKELETLLVKYPNPKKYLEDLEISIEQTISEKNKLIEELKLGGSELKLIEILDFHAWYQDCRKEYTMMVLHHIDLVLNELAKRKGIALRDIKWLLAEEILSQKPIEKLNALIKTRKQYAFFVWENDKFFSFTGEDARKIEKTVLGSIKSSHEIIEIPGNIANKGKVQGIARVTMDPQDAKHIQKGEILVTSMTSPDFVSAIKKASAIVTNEGGILCHAAIVSREFGIPCIVGTGIATRAIKSGDFIEVDANHGFVRILKR